MRHDWFLEAFCPLLPVAVLVYMIVMTVRDACG